MSKLVFDGVVGSPPYDRAAELTGWRLAGGSTHPVPTTGSQPLGVQLDGTAGYEADDVGSVHMGLQSWSVRLACQPDFDALAGLTATLIARGKGGPTAGDYWAWEVALAVAANGLTANVILAWQDADTGTVQAFTLGTVERPGSARWNHIMVSREVVASGTYLRLVVDGELVGELGSEITAGADIPATPGKTVTLGCRRNGAAFERFFVGVLGPVEVLRAGQTVEQARHAYRDLLVLPELAAETYRLYSAHDYPPTRGSVYERYRVIPMGAALATVDDAVETRLDASLPDTAYGARLEAWEAALGFTGAANLSLAERQERVAAAIALAEGISRTFLGAYAYSLINGVVPDGDSYREQFEDLSGVTWDHLWAGAAVDLVAGVTLSAAGGALDQQSPMRSTFQLNSNVFRFPGGTGAWVAPSNTVGDILNGTSTLVAVSVYLPEIPASVSYLCRKFSGGVGYVLYLQDGRFSALFTGGGSFPLALTRQSVAGWNTFVLLVNRTTGVATVASAHEERSLSVAAGSFQNTDLLRLGDSIGVSNSHDLGFVGFASGVDVEIPPRQLARRLQVTQAGIYEQANDITVDFRVRHGWRVYGNLAVSYNGTRATVGIANTAVTAKYTQPLPTSNAQGAGFQEIAVADANWQVLLDIEPDAANPSTATTWAGFVMRSHVDVQWLAVRANGRLYAMRSLGGAAATVEDLGALPASASKRWELAVSYGQATGKTRVRARAFEDAGALDTWAEFLTNTSSISMPNWLGLGVQANATGSQAQAFVYSMRISLAAVAAARWYLLAGLPRVSDIEDLLRRKNRAASFVAFSGDDHALFDSPNTSANSTPTPRL